MVFSSILSSCVLTKIEKVIYICQTLIVKVLLNGGGLDFLSNLLLVYRTPQTKDPPDEAVQALAIDSIRGA
jgi:hypothetical protein